MENYTVDALRIAIHESPLMFTVEWEGECSARDPSIALTPYLNDLSAQTEGKRVRIVFANLEYMNSCAVRPIMNFIRAVAGVAESVRVEYSNGLQWQVTSFRAMRVVARNWSNVEVIGV